MTVLVLLVTLTLGLLVAPRASHAQQPGQMPRIGFVEPGSAAVNGHFLAAFRQGLRAFGWVEGQNLVIEDRWAEGQYERFPALLAELLQLKVQVIVVSSGVGTLAAKQATATVPIVFTGVDDPIGDGLVASLARPGGNLTGLANIGPQLSGKRLEIFREALPHLAHVAVLLEPYNATAHMQETERAARAFGITLQFLQVRAPSEFDAAFVALTRERLDGLMVWSGPVLFRHRARIVELVAQSRLPTIYSLREYVDAGGLMAYGHSLPDRFRRAATYVDKILKGAKPADLPVEQPTKFELVINLKTAQTLGLTIPPTLLFQADEVIR
jgi:putative tryptophan/tyrosine transport system substrate-binding protein